MRNLNLRKPEKVTQRCSPFRGPGPSQSLAFSEARCSSSSCATAARPPIAARCSGVSSRTAAAGRTGPWGARLRSSVACTAAGRCRKMCRAAGRLPLKAAEKMSLRPRRHGARCQRQSPQRGDVALRLLCGVDLVRLHGKMPKSCHK